MAQFALVGFPGAVPSSSPTQVTPVTKRFELDGAKNRAGLRIDLMDLAVAVLGDPECSLRPGHSGGAAIGRRDGRDNVAGLRIDLLNSVAGDLEQMLAVESPVPACAGTSIARTVLPLSGSTAFERFAGRDPDIGTVVAYAMHVGDTRKGAVFADDVCCCSFHNVILSAVRLVRSNSTTGQRGRE